MQHSDSHNRSLPDYVVIGVVTKPHGVRGALKIRPLTDEPTRFKDLTELYLAIDGHRTLFEVDSARVSSDYVVLKLKGIDHRNQAEHWRQYDIEIPREWVRELPEGQFYYYELMGLKGFLSNGTYLGVLQDIISNPGQDVYVFLNPEDDKEVLVPAVPEWIQNIDIEQGTITVSDGPGLLE
ncbi:16S rRNA processing protein RimM [candidate division KSB1 bacterium]|jgi:16S rRNA processing protein RimM|nr:16S rRNA processing protein RimM [candidate division KSB1 bacterium]